jgi:hypothetical protein
LLSAGSWNGVKVPLRARISQAVSSTAMEKKRVTTMYVNRAAFSAQPSGGVVALDAGSTRAMPASAW